MVLLYSSLGLPSAAMAAAAAAVALTAAGVLPLLLPLLALMPPLTLPKGSKGANANGMCCGSIAP